jgi:hypothetical protein
VLSNRSKLFATFAGFFIALAFAAATALLVISFLNRTDVTAGWNDAYFLLVEQVFLWSSFIADASCSVVLLLRLRRMRREAHFNIASVPGWTLHMLTYFQTTRHTRQGTICPEAGCQLTGRRSEGSHSKRRLFLPGSPWSRQSSAFLSTGLTATRVRHNARPQGMSYASASVCHLPDPSASSLLDILVR